MSWYSATIFSMINDYFRREFNEYVKIDAPPSPSPSSSLPPGTDKSNTIQHTTPISSNNKLEMPNISLQINSTSTAPAAAAAAADDDEQRSQAVMTSRTMTITGHFNQQNNKILNKPPLIPGIITANTGVERLVYSDNGRCHFGEYAVQLLSGNPVCMRRR